MIKAKIITWCVNFAWPMNIFFHLYFPETLFESSKIWNFSFYKQDAWSLGTFNAFKANSVFALCSANRVDSITHL